MRILIGTPAFEDKLTTHFAKALISTIPMLQGMGHEVATVFDGSGGGPGKSRDMIAQFALEKEFTHLLFIDADVIWRPWQVDALVTANKPIVGGVYPLRSYPIRLNFNPLDEDAKHFKDVGKTPEAFNALVREKAHGDGLVKVKQLATGFLMISTDVFRALDEKVERYNIVNAMDLKVYERKEYFPYRLQKRHGLTLYETEDWMFCNMAREAGFDIWMHAGCVVDHVGTHIFSARSQL